MLKRLIDMWNKAKVLKSLRIAAAVSIAAILLLHLCCYLTANSQSKSRVSSGCSSIRLVKIQDIEVGERSIGKNPQLTDKERSEFFADPDPATWRKLSLAMTKSDGKRLDVTLLRPLTWIEKTGAEQGQTIYLNLPEMGAVGDANVITIDPCPPIKPGKGNVITGTFHHEAGQTIDIHVQGLDKPIGCTANHPFWSATRQDFVEAGTLLHQEDLLLYDGRITKVIQILPRPGPERVHNLEVLNEHVYHVENIGVLVHNKCISRIHENAALVKHAEIAGQSVQKSLDKMTASLMIGNVHMGTDAHQLFGNVCEMRSADGARLYYRRNGDTYEILAKSSKHNQDAVIQILKTLY